MSNKYVSKFFEITGRANPYRNSGGQIEYSRFIAVIMLEAVAAILWFLKIPNEHLEDDKPYNLVAYFYKYTLVWPLEQLKSVLAWFKNIPTTGYAKVDQFVTYGGLVGYIFLVMSLYLVMYVGFLHTKKHHFKIGDFLGAWCVPLFLGLMWGFGVMTIEWVVALKASLQ